MKTIRWGMIGRGDFLDFLFGPISEVRAFAANQAGAYRPEESSRPTQPMIQAIVDELNGKGKCASTGESAARTAQVMDAILGEFRARSS